MKIKKCANNFGLLFQIYDDIIDCTLSTEDIGKTAGKDKNSNKLTYANAYGIEKSKEIFYSLINSTYRLIIRRKNLFYIFNSLILCIFNKLSIIY